MLLYVRLRKSNIMELHHALNRGVEKKNIFLDTQDYARFVHDLFEFNKVPPTHNLRRLTGGDNKKMFDLRSRTSDKKLVDLHGWCLMKNHYHLLLSERIDGGRVLFLRRLNIGYAKYFNEKYKRSGYLFQGRTKKVPVTTDAHFLHILHYIHLNPLDFLSGAQKWRALKVRDTARALAHLDAYKWSSYRDYCGIRNFPSILSIDLFSDVFGNYRKTIGEYLRDIKVEFIRDMILE